MTASNGSLIGTSNKGLTANDHQRDLMIEAAVAYDETQKRIASLEHKLSRAVAALEAKNAEIDNLNLLLTQERNRNDNHRNERDQAVADRAEALAILSNLRAMLEKAEIPMPLSRKGNGKGNGNAVADIEAGRKSSPERRPSNAEVAA